MAVTCKDILELNACKKIRLIGGQEGLDNIVTWPFIKNMETISEWIHGGEIVFVIGAKEDISEQGMLNLMEEAVKSKISGIVILIGEDYIRKIPRTVIRFANVHKLPLFKMPFGLKLIDVTREISQFIVDDQIKNKEYNVLSEKSIIDVLLQNENKEEIISYCIQKLQPLIEVDHVTGSEYVKTLRIFLECGEDVIKTSQYMYIHRNTMNNRMKKIEILLDTRVREAKVASEYRDIFKVLDHFSINV